MGKHKKTLSAQEAEAQAKADAFDARIGKSVVRAADKRLKGHLPYNLEATLSDLRNKKGKK